MWKNSPAVCGCAENGGMLQAFGSGHSKRERASYASKAGGFIPTKQIKEPASGAYEGIEGVGTAFMKKVDIRPNDVVVLISNSGRNPSPVEIALGAHEKARRSLRSLRWKRRSIYHRSIPAGRICGAWRTS